MLARRRAAAQLLHRPVSVRDPVEVARATAGIQAQDALAARLSFRARSRRLTAAAVDRARTQARSLVRTWLMRKTIHLIPTEDAGWMLPLFEPIVERWSRRRLQQLGMPPATQERALREVRRMLERDGPLTRPEVAGRLESAGIELNQQTRLHITGLAVTSGLAVLGPDRRAAVCLVLRRDWLDAPPPFDREAALAELAVRYLRAFGPATDRDMAAWAGLGLGDVRAGLAVIADRIEEQRVGEQALIALRRSAARLPRAGQVRMLGAFDTYMLGYANRDFALPREHAAAINRGGGGMIRPVIVRDGAVIGSWRSRRAKGGLEIALDPFLPIEPALGSAIGAEVADIARFEGMPATLA